MRHFVTEENGVFKVVSATGFTPKNSIGTLPADFPLEDRAFIKVEEVQEDEMSAPTKVFSVDVAAKQATIEADSKTEQVQAAYDRMIKDIFDELFAVLEHVLQRQQTLTLRLTSTCKRTQKCTSFLALKP